MPCGERVGNAGLSAYQSAKWALGGFTEVLAAEVNPLGIRTTLVEPGGTRTDWAGTTHSTDDPNQPLIHVVETLSGPNACSDSTYLNFKITY